MGKNKQPDKELQAMRRIIAILEELPISARQRVVQYSVNRAFKPDAAMEPVKDDRQQELPLKEAV